DCARPRTANFALLNATAPPRPRTEEVAPVKMIAPAPHSSMSSTASRAQRNAPQTPIRQDCSNCSGVVSVKPLPIEPLAFAMRISTGPSCCRTLWKAAATCFGSETSVGIASAFLPISVASLPMNSGDRANMPMLQSSLTSFRTSAAPKPGPTPATIATHFLFASAINVWIAGAMLLSRAKQYAKAQLAVLAERFSCDPIIRRVFLPVGARAQGYHHLVIATRAAHEMAGQKVCPAS